MILKYIIHVANLNTTAEYCELTCILLIHYVR